MHACLPPACAFSRRDRCLPWSPPHNVRTGLPTTYNLSISRIATHAGQACLWVWAAPTLAITSMHACMDQAGRQGCKAASQSIDHPPCPARMACTCAEAFNVWYSLSPLEHAMLSSMAPLRSPYNVRMWMIVARMLCLLYMCVCGGEQQTCVGQRKDTNAPAWLPGRAVNSILPLREHAQWQGVHHYVSRTLSFEAQAGGAAVQFDFGVTRWRPHPNVLAWSHGDGDAHMQGWEWRLQPFQAPPAGRFIMR